MGCMEPHAGAASCPECGWKRSTPPESALHLAPGTRLHNQYVVGRVLGQGGFGVTYLGWDLQLERKVAIKEYLPQALASREPGSSTVAPITGPLRESFDYGLQSFLKEGYILARFDDHPCIVSVIGLFEQNRTGYLVMAYLDGVTLAQSLAAHGGKFPCGAAVQIMMRVMDGLREVHEQGILHRDISPDNIYLTRQGPVKILDFGAARVAIGERSQNLSVVLKEGFAPEEQYRRSGNQGPWTDIYATAATLYRCITGITPPPALDRLHHDTLRSPRELGVEIPRNVEAALLRGLAVSAGRRFQSIEAFQSALQGDIPGESGFESAPSAGGRWTAAARYFGISVFLASVFPVAVSLGPGQGVPGWKCAWLAFKLWNSPAVFGGLINPLMLIYGMLLPGSRFAGLRRGIAGAIALVCLPMTWYFLSKARLDVEIGHVLWVAGVLLLLAPELKGAGRR